MNTPNTDPEYEMQADNGNESGIGTLFVIGVLALTLGAVVLIDAAASGVQHLTNKLTRKQNR